MIVAYNRYDADEHIAFAETESYSVSADSTQKDSTNVSDLTLSNIPADSIYYERIKRDTIGDIDKKNIGDKILLKVLRPTDSSLSGIGAVFYYKNLTGKVVIALSLLISLMMLLLFRFLRSQRVKYWLQLINVVCVVVLIVDSIISDVTLLWGSGVLLFLLLFQFFVGRGERKKTTV